MPCVVRLRCAELCPCAASPNVSVVTPQFGPIVGGSIVTVRGGPFVRTAAVAVCKFGSAVVAASFTTESELRCITPAQSVSTVQFEVSLNNHDFTSSGVVYQYVGMLQLVFGVRVASLRVCVWRSA